MRPPIPTSDRKQDEDLQKKQRAAMVPMVIGLVAIGAFAIYTIWDSMRPHVEKKIVTGQMIEYSDYGDATDGDFQTYASLGSNLLTGNSPEGLMLIHAGDRSLLSEPAGLAPIPGGERISAFQRQSGQIAEQISVWLTPQDWDVKRTADHYRAAAASQGFQQLEKKSERSDSLANLTFYRRSNKQHHAPDQTLFIRIDQPTGGSPRAFVWYRFPDADS